MKPCLYIAFESLAHTRAMRNRRLESPACPPEIRPIGRFPALRRGLLREIGTRLSHRAVALWTERSRGARPLRPAIRICRRHRCRQHISHLHGYPARPMHQWRFAPHSHGYRDQSAPILRQRDDFRTLAAQAQRNTPDALCPPKTGCLGRCHDRFHIRRGPTGVDVPARLVL